jgi:hypothetical protein
MPSTLLHKVSTTKCQFKENTKGMFGSAVMGIDFDRIDFLKLILAKIDFKLK